MVLLVVDTQKGIVDERLYAFEKFVRNIRKLIRTAREQGIEVVYVQHDDGPGTGFSIGDDEFEVYSGFAPLLTEKRFVKTVCSAFKKESGLLEYLTEKDEKDVMVCGIMTHRRTLAKRAAREVTFSDLSESELAQLFTTDEYESDYFRFHRLFIASSKDGSYL